MHGLMRDLRFGFRRLRLAPAFTSLAASTLALSIGATTATYSVVDGLMLRPLPYPDPSRLVDVSVLTPDGISRRNQPRRFVVRQHFPQRRQVRSDNRSAPCHVFKELQRRGIQLGNCRRRVRQHEDLRS